MFAAAQAALVGVVEEARQAAQAGGVSDGRLPPAFVGPYQGELLRPGIAALTPAVFVELDDGTLEAISMGRGEYRGTLPFDIICAVYNEASAEAAYSDGVALLTWTLETLVAAIKEGALSVGGGAFSDAPFKMAWDSFRFRRVVIGKNLWAYALTPNIEIV